MGCWAFWNFQRQGERGEVGTACDKVQTFFWNLIIQGKTVLVHMTDIKVIACDNLHQEAMAMETIFRTCLQDIYL